ncbi:sulfite exporter TauE/SafE family protein [Hyphomonas johnsonii]|jgi:hypothetical protein|uniref:Transmembrane protein n=1 Tax=Hyphomonas johnsonii MHS-2 TaxID=1280950 RepID=A0A059FTE0_9PROT|nr:sulfite exporter TauE/SafE family protein [Hyphomonas johnsonii]KCZ93934.1 hypothetical protein HJO_01125 [Hyphomonas johnsonii MHS-2]
MLKKTVRWGADVGCQSKIKPLDPKAELTDFGLKGKLAEGELGFSRMLTKRDAKKDAADGLPVSEAITPDQWSEREQQIAERAEAVRRGLNTWMSTTAANVRNFIHDCTPIDIYPDQLREAIKSEENEYRHYEQDDRSDAKHSHDEAIIELQTFRARHGDRIGDRTPDIKKNVEQTVAILVFIMLLEGGFNALLFKDAQASGLLGGLMIAFAVSAVNVCIGVITGFFGLRYAFNHPNIALKVLGGTVMAVGLVSGLFLNLFVAHFRDAVETGLIAATAAGTMAEFSMFDISPATVMSSMFPNIIGLESFIAMGLLFMGLTVFGLAVYEGYDRISDRYPGYGRVWRKERKAYERRQAVRNGVRDDLSEYFTQCRLWFETQLSRHAAAKREIEKAMNVLDSRRDVAASIAANAADQERSLKVAYRQAHRRQRNQLRDKLGEQAACPAYFDEIVTPQLPPFDFKKERDQANAAIKTIDQNLTALNLTREWLETHIQQVQKGLSSIEKKVGEEIEKVREGKSAGKAFVSVDEARRA